MAWNFEVFVDFLREKVVDLSMGRPCQSAMPGFGLASSPSRERLRLRTF
jgi:hypothetical protein